MVFNRVPGNGWLDLDDFLADPHVISILMKCCENQTGKTGQTGETAQTAQTAETSKTAQTTQKAYTGQTGQTFRLIFPGNL